MGQLGKWFGESGGQEETDVAAWPHTHELASVQIDKTARYRITYASLASCTLFVLPTVATYHHGD